MSKKTSAVTEIKENIKSVPAPEVLRNNFMPYSMSVIVSRAIPNIEDGLKPSHRKILYTMYEMGLLNGPRTKSANVAASCMRYNPHGDAANYDTAVRLTEANETLPTPLIDGKGSFGKHFSRDMQAAASRYTEMRLLPVAGEFFRSIRKNTVDMVDNYDATRKEPVLLPVTFPNVLAMPTEGIAVGFASSIPSFNLSELCDATVQRIKHPHDSVRNVMPAPDFTTGGYMLLDEDAMKEVYDTGRGSVKLRAKYSVDQKNRIIEVTEIPYSTTAEAIIESVIDLIKKNKINEISDIRNEIDLKGFKIAIDYKRGVDPDSLMKKLYKLTKLQDVFPCNMTVLVNERPVVLGVEQILDEWIKWRRGCVVRELQYDRANKAHSLHLLQGLAAVLLDIDKAIRIVRETENDEQVIPNLMSAFSIDEEQAEYVAEIKLRNLNKDYILNRTKAIESLIRDINEIDSQLGSQTAMDKLIIATLQDVKKKYGKPRKTEIIPDEQEEAKPSDVIPEYPVHVFITKELYIKKIPSTSLKGQYEIKVKEGDTVVQDLSSMNTQELLIFTDRHNCYKLRIGDLRDEKPSDIGDLVTNLVDLEDGEKVVFITASDAGKELLIAFKNGKCARIPLSAYETKFARKKLLNAYSDLEEVFGFYVLTEPSDFVFRTSNKRTLLFNSSLVPLKSTKTTQGVQVIRLGKGASCKSFELAETAKLKRAEVYRTQKIPSGGK